MRRSHIRRTVLLMAFVLCPRAGHAQQAGATQQGAKPAAPCVKRAAADTGKVVLADSSAPARWSKETLATIARHEVCVGMTADMLRKSWGIPTNINALIPGTPGDTTAQYFYRGATVVVVNSTVRAIRPPTKPHRP
jgi:hypothetical protein